MSDPRNCWANGRTLDKQPIGRWIKIPNYVVAAKLNMHAVVQKLHAHSEMTERVKMDGPDRRMAPCDAEGAGR